MEFRSQDDQHEIYTPTSHHQHNRSSAFSKPASASTSQSPSSLIGFGSNNNNNGTNNSASEPAATTDTSQKVNYHECLRNHAASLGGHVVDGCGEFMPASGNDQLKCAACGCHRSFHRRESSLPNTSALTTPRLPLLLPPPHPYNIQASHQVQRLQQHQQYLPNTTSGTSGGTTTESSSEDRGPPAPANAMMGTTGGGASTRKRVRTKFTPQQKERMFGFAERVGWRMNKQDEALVEQFCAEVGVRRQVFKVWMHNNKHNNVRRLHPQQQQEQQYNENQEERVVQEQVVVPLPQLHEEQQHQQLQSQSQHQH